MIIKSIVVEIEGSKAQRLFAKPINHANIKQVIYPKTGAKICIYGFSGDFYDDAKMVSLEIFANTIVRGVMDGQDCLDTLRMLQELEPEMQYDESLS